MFFVSRFLQHAFYSVVVVRAALSASTICSPPGLPSDWTNLSSAAHPVGPEWYGADISTPWAAMEEVKAGLQRHLSEGGVNGRLEAHIFILVWNNARRENVQTETLLRGWVMAWRPQVQFLEWHLGVLDHDLSSYYLNSVFFWWEHLCKVKPTNIIMRNNSWNNKTDGKIVILQLLFLRFSAMKV